MAPSRKQIIIGALLIITIALGFTLRTYWNADAADLGSGSYVLSGNDPYYHKHAVDHITESWSTLERDAMLNYPAGSVNPNPPLHQWTVAAGAKAMEVFTGDLERATWLSMLYLPAIWGTLTIIPAFLIARMYMGNWAGLLAGFLVATSPEHMSRTNLGFADHDALVIFLATFGFYFLLRAARETGDHRKFASAKGLVGDYTEWFKNERVAAGSSLLAGGFFGALALTWKGFPYAFGVVLAYAGIQFLLNHWRGKDVARPLFALTTALGVASLASLPYYSSLGLMHFWNPSLFLLAALVTLGAYFLATQEYPSILVIPGLLVVAAVFAAIMFVVVPDIAQALLNRLVYFRNTTLYTTIAEAHPSGFSSLAFAVGPIPFFMYLAGFMWLIGRVWSKVRPEEVFFLIWCTVDFVLAISAVRFLSLSVPTQAILAAVATVWLVKLLELPNLSERYRQSGFRNLGRKMSATQVAALGALGTLGLVVLFAGHTIPAVALFVGIVLYVVLASLGLDAGRNFMYVTSVLFVGLLILIPNAALAVDAAVPSNLEQERASEAREAAFEEVTAKAHELGLSTETRRQVQQALNASRGPGDFRTNLNDIQLRLGLDRGTTDVLHAAAADDLATVALYSKTLGAFGQSFLPEGWRDILNDLATRDTDQAPPDRPGFLAWWDYGHWSIAVGKHPAVADNFQNGYQLAGSFIASQNESHSIQLMGARMAKARVLEDNQFTPVFTEDTYTRTLTDRGIDAFDAERFWEAFQNNRFPYIPFAEDEKEAIAISADWLAELEAASDKRIRYFAVDNRMLPLDNPNTPRIENPSIFYAPVTLAGHDPQTYVEQAVVDQETGQRVSDEELRRLQRDPNAQPNLGQQLFYHDRFFDSMFYRSFMGLPVNQPIEQQGQTFPIPFNRDNFPQFYQDPRMLRAPGEVSGAALSNEVAPGFGLEHFRLVQANQAVRMLEYYPGAVVEGTVTHQGEAMPGVRVTAFDDAGELVKQTNPRYFEGREAATLDIPHDSVIADEEGRFSLIAPFSTTDRGITLKVTQEGAEGAPVLATASMQISREQTNARERLQVDITVEPASLTGIAFLDRDGDGALGANDTRLPNVEVQVGNATTTTDDDGRYALNGLAPGSSTVSATRDHMVMRAGTGDVTLVGGETVEKNLTMTYVPAQAAATVVDEGGERLEGANLRFVPAEGNATGAQASGFTQVNGTVTVSLQPGVYQLTGNKTQDGQETHRFLDVHVVGGTGATVNEAGELVVDPGAEALELEVRFETVFA